MSQPQSRSIYEAAGGFEAMLTLAHAWHQRMLQHELTAHPFHPPIKPDHTERLAAYWSQALGGPPLYTDRYGDESAVVRRHSGNGEYPEINALSIEAFRNALGDVGLDRDPDLHTALLDYFVWATNNTMTSYPHSKEDVPDGLSLPRWSWDGLVNAPAGEG